MKSSIVILVLIIMVTISVCINVHLWSGTTTSKTERKIDVLTTKISELERSISQRQGRDSIYNGQVQQITNNFKKIYEKTNDRNFTDFDSFIDSLLAEHRAVKVERNYKIPR